MSHKGKKLSQQENRPSTHAIPTIKALKAQITTLQKQVEEIKQNKYQEGESTNITLMKLNENDRCFNSGRINENIGFIERQLIEMRNGFKLTSLINSLIAGVQYEFQVLDSTLHDKEFRIQELEKVNEQLKYQLLQIETEKQLHLHDNQQQTQIINEQDQQLNQQLTKINDYQAIINSYQSQNLQLTYELNQTDKTILQLRQRFQSAENSLGVELEWKEKLNKQKEKNIKLQTENEYYEDYLEDVFETIRKMEQELIFCRKELKVWKERYFQDQ